MFPLEDIELPPYRENGLDDLPQPGVKMADSNGDHAKFLKSGRWKNAIQSYLATVAYLDMNIGRFIDGLDKSPIAEDTPVDLMSIYPTLCELAITMPIPTSGRTWHTRPSMHV